MACACLVRMPVLSLFILTWLAPLQDWEGFLQIMLGATFSMLAGYGTWGPLSNPTPMLILMMAIAVLGICMASYVVYIDAQELRKNLVRSAKCRILKMSKDTHHRRNIGRGPVSPHGRK